MVSNKKLSNELEGLKFNRQKTKKVQESKTLQTIPNPDHNDDDSPSSRKTSSLSKMLNRRCKKDGSAKRERSLSPTQNSLESFEDSGEDSPKEEQNLSTSTRSSRTRRNKTKSIHNSVEDKNPSTITARSTRTQKNKAKSSDDSGELIVSDNSRGTKSRRTVKSSKRTDAAAITIQAFVRMAFQQMEFRAILLETKVNYIDESRVRKLESIELHKNKTMKEYKEVMLKTSRATVSTDISSEKSNLKLFATNDKVLSERINAIKVLKKENLELNKQRKLLTSRLAVVNRRHCVHKIVSNERRKIHQEQRNTKKALEETISIYQSNIHTTKLSLQNCLNSYLEESRMKIVYVKCITSALSLLHSHCKSKGEEKLVGALYIKVLELQQSDYSKPYHPRAGAHLSEDRDEAASKVQALVRAFFVRSYLDCRMHTTLINELQHGDDNMNANNSETGSSKSQPNVLPGGKEGLEAKEGCVRFSTTVEMRRIPARNEDLFDSCYYSEEECANFRYEAFMEECGLDPADFPD